MSFFDFFVITAVYWGMSFVVLGIAYFVSKIFKPDAKHEKYALKIVGFVLLLVGIPLFLLLISDTTNDETGMGAVFGIFYFPPIVYSSVITAYVVAYQISKRK